LHRQIQDDSAVRVLWQLLPEQLELALRGLADRHGSVSVMARKGRCIGLSGSDSVVRDRA